MLPILIANTRSIAHKSKYEAGVFLGDQQVMQISDATLKDAEEMRNRLAAIVASSDDAIISKTLDGIIVTWNEGASAHLRVLARRSDRQAHHHPYSARPTRRRTGHPCAAAAGERVDHYRDVPRPQGRAPRQHLAHRLADAKRRRANHRRIEDRARHHARRSKPKKPCG